MLGVALAAPTPEEAGRGWAEHWSDLGRSSKAFRFTKRRPHCDRNQPALGREDLTKYFFFPLPPSLLLPSLSNGPTPMMKTTTWPMQPALMMAPSLHSAQLLARCGSGRRQGRQRQGRRIDVGIAHVRAGGQEVLQAQEGGRRGSL